jgi:hypothetical protein
MHIIDMTFDDVPVRLVFNKSGLVDVRVTGTTGVLLYRAYMKDVMEWVATKAADVKRGAGKRFCPDCGDVLRPCDGGCTYCE